MLNFAAINVVLLLSSAITTFKVVQCSHITYVPPQRSLRCSPEDDPCRKTLTVSEMQTLNAYCVNADGGRGESSVPVTVNEEGRFDFVYGEDSVNSCGPNTTRLFQPIVADGITLRNLLVVNDQLPGPILIGYKNQRVQITVINDLGKEAITLHWHGQHVNGSQFMDGVPFVTQCPIQPGNRFVYDFQLFPAGTYWYHSHQYDERSNGMYGALVVLDPDAPTDPGYIDLPEQHTIAFFEWFPVNSDEWVEAPYTLADPTNESIPYCPTTTLDGSEAGGGDPPFIAGLMNSVGWRYTPGASDCRRVANTTLSFFNVTRDSSYRFRLVGSQIDFAYRFSISGHRLRVIATDGIDATVPSSITDLVDFIIVHIGERYDFVLEASADVDNYLMIAETLENPAVLNHRGYCIKAHRVYGVLHYEGASDILPDDFDDSYDPLTRCNPPAEQCFALNCPFENYPSSFNIQCISVVNLQLSTPEPVPSGNVNPSLFLNFGFTPPFGPSINGRSFSVPTSPLLSQANDNLESLFCIPNDPPFNPFGNNTILQCIDHYNVETDAVEFVYSNIQGIGTSHPVHLHGHHYFVLDIGYPTYFPNGTIESPNPNIVCAEPSCSTSVIWSNNNTPPPSPCMETNTCPMKDTVIVPVGGYVRVRFPRNNWGWWIMHCHIEPHLLGGMALVVNETSFLGNAVDTPNGFPTCGDFPPLNPPTLTTAPLSNQELDQFRDATIALGVISALLLLALIAMTIVVIVLCYIRREGSSGGGSSSRKVEVELK